MAFTISNYMRPSKGERICYSKHTARLRKTVIQTSERRSGWVRHRSPTLLQTRHMSIMASQITGHLSVCSTISSGQHQRHMKALRYWPFVRGIRRWPLNSRTKDQWRGKCFHLMTSACSRKMSGWPCRANSNQICINPQMHIIPVGRT